MLEDRGAGLTPGGEGDARVLVAADMTLRERLADVARFAVHPTFVAQPQAWGRAAALALLAVFALDLALSELFAAVTGALDPAGSVLPQPVEQDISLAEDIFTALLLAPVLEELLFRGWLTGRGPALRFAVWGFAALGLFTASLLVPPALTIPVALAGVAAVMTGLVEWSRWRHGDTAVPGWFVRHYGWFVWGQALLFGFIHLGNYEPLAHPLGLLVVLPQTIGGLLLAYTRTRLGLGAAIAHHAAYNALWLVADYAGW
jgi:membrane protease YdiL (CAAX protease family)